MIIITQERDGNAMLLRSLFHKAHNGAGVGVDENFHITHGSAAVWITPSSLFSNISQDAAMLRSFTVQNQVQRRASHAMPSAIRRPG